MAKTLLNAVNEVLSRVGVITGDSGLLTSLTDSARQPFVDTAVQVINEGIDELYSVSRKTKPQEQSEDLIVLSTGLREYSLPDDLVKIIWPLVDRTNNQFIYEAAGGYNNMLMSDPEQDDTGLPIEGAISPVTGDLFLDSAPTALENGRVYYMQYHKDVGLALLTDRVPFSDAVFRAMVPAWAEMWKRDKRREFDESFLKTETGRASRLLIKVESRSSYLPR